MAGAGTVLFAGLLVVGASVPSRHTEAELLAMHAQFRKEFQKPDADNDSESQRFVAFKHNVARAYALNSEQGINCTDLFVDSKCVFGITKFADMFQDEFAATHLGYRRAAVRPEAVVVAADANFSAARAVDWRKHGAVTRVKDQGRCGSCWAFSATEAIESALFMKTKHLKHLSTQQVISCDKTDAGCNGGDTVTAYQYVRKAGGIGLASDYPDRSHVTGKGGKCTRGHKKVARISGFTWAAKPCKSGACKHQDEGALASFIAQHGPVSICVNAEGWNLYKHGVYSRKCSGALNDLDHCVQLVGFDKAASSPYWIVRNTWTTDWGEKGFMRLKMGENVCGVADEATLPQIAVEQLADFLV